MSGLARSYGTHFAPPERKFKGRVSVFPGGKAAVCGRFPSCKFACTRLFCRKMLEKGEFF